LGELRKCITSPDITIYFFKIYWRFSYIYLTAHCVHCCPCREFLIIWWLWGGGDFLLCLLVEHWTWDKTRLSAFYLFKRKTKNTGLILYSVTLTRRERFQALIYLSAVSFQLFFFFLLSDLFQNVSPKKSQIWENTWKKKELK
jgi:hypothetical protein